MSKDINKLVWSKFLRSCAWLIEHGYLKPPELKGEEEIMYALIAGIPAMKNKYDKRSYWDFIAELVSGIGITLHFKGE